MPEHPFSLAAILAIAILVWFLLRFGRRHMLPTIRRVPKSRSIIGLIIMLLSIAGGVYLRYAGF